MTSPFEHAVRRQHERLRAALDAGMPRLGWKICLNEPRTQRRLGLAGPFVGFLDGTRCLETGAVCVPPSAASLAVEPEIAIRVEAATGAIAALAPALEIVDYTRGAFTLDGVVESSSFHHGVVLGAVRGPGAVAVLGPDCPRLLRDGARAAEPDPALVSCDLSDIVRFVGRFLAAHGAELRPGDWILSGACTPPVRVEGGEHIEADFGALGQVAVRIGSPAPEAA